MIAFISFSSIFYNQFLFAFFCLSDSIIHLLLSKYYPLMIQNKLPQLPLFYKYLTLEHILWLESKRNNYQYSQIIKQEQLFQPPRIHSEVKIEENQDTQTQKTQNRSANSGPQVKRQAEPASQMSIQQKDEVKLQQSILKQSQVSKRNETKNISKNFGKAILSFIKFNSKFTKKLLKKFQVEKQSLRAYVKKSRKNLNSLQDLRQMWGAGNENDTLKKCLRIASHYFMRKHCLQYIFNSRIRSMSAHTKYRHRLMEGLCKPSQFTNIKVK